jgi:hypothetical protein
MFILKDIPWRRTLGHYAGEATHDPVEIFLFYEPEKKQGNKKRVCLLKGGFLYSCILLRFRNTLELRPSGVPPPGECTCTGTSLTTKSTVISSRVGTS